MPTVARFASHASGKLKFPWKYALVAWSLLGGLAGAETGETEDAVAPCPLSPVRRQATASAVPATAAHPMADTKPAACVARHADLSADVLRIDVRVRAAEIKELPVIPGAVSMPLNRVATSTLVRNQPSVLIGSGRNDHRLLALCAELRREQGRASISVLIGGARALPNKPETALEKSAIPDSEQLSVSEFAELFGLPASQRVIAYPGPRKNPLLRTGQMLPAAPATPALQRFLRAFPLPFGATVPVAIASEDTAQAAAWRNALHRQGRWNVLFFTRPLAELDAYLKQQDAIVRSREWRPPTACERS